MRCLPFEFEEMQIIKELVEAGVPGVKRALKRVNEFRRMNGLPERSYKSVSDRLHKVRHRTDHGNIFGHTLGYGPKITPERQAEAYRRRVPRPYGDPLPEESALAQPRPKSKRVRRDPLDFSDLEPEARFLALWQFQTHAPEIAA